MSEKSRLIGHKTLFSNLIYLDQIEKFPNNILLNGPKGIGKKLLVSHLLNYLYSKNNEQLYNFKNNEYNDASYCDVEKVSKIANCDVNIIKGIFPKSMELISLQKPISFAHIDVDTYISAKESLEFITNHALKGAVVILDDYGGWFTDGVTKLGNELKEDKKFFVVPNHLGQMVIYVIN